LPAASELAPEPGRIHRLVDAKSSGLVDHCGSVAGLDPAARRTTWELVRAIRARGTTVVLVTHLMPEAEQLCDRIAVLDRGRLIALDTAAALARAQGATCLEDAVLALTGRG